jgi:hypothetical protein
MSLERYARNESNETNETVAVTVRRHRFFRDRFFWVPILRHAIA